MNAAKLILLAFSLLYAGNALAQGVEKEPAAIMELGGATDWSITEGGSSFGPTVAVEVTPIENWLELEAGVTPLFSPSLDRMGYRLSFQKTLDALEKSGVHGRYRAGVGSCEKLQLDHELHQWRSRAGFYVLAICKTQIRLVPRTGLRIQLRVRA